LGIAQPLLPVFEKVVGFAAGYWPPLLPPVIRHFDLF
jgi:hypothetical protein